MDPFGIVGIGIAAFLGSNIDDLFILMIFLANTRFPKSQVVLGQFAGMGALIGIAAILSLVSLVIPSNWLVLLGLFPIAIGIKELIELRKGNNNEASDAAEKAARSRRISFLPFLTVAAVTFAGGEEIGIYASVFATSNELSEIATVVIVGLILTGIWCVTANYLVTRPSIAARMRRIGGHSLPFILVGLGIYIIAEPFVVG